MRLHIKCEHVRQINVEDGELVIDADAERIAAAIGMTPSADEARLLSMLLGKTDLNAFFAAIDILLNEREGLTGPETFSALVRSVERIALWAEEGDHGSQDTLAKIRRAATPRTIHHVGSAE